MLEAAEDGGKMSGQVDTFTVSLHTFLPDHFAENSSWPTFFSVKLLYLAMNIIEVSS